MQKTKKHTAMALIALVLAVFLSARCGADVISDLRKNIIASRPYTLGTETEVALAGDQTVKLLCAQNEWGVREIVVGQLQSQGSIIYAYFAMQDGSVSGGGSKIELKGAYRQVGVNPVLAVITWKADGPNVKVQFRTETDLARGRAIMKPILDKFRGGNSSLGVSLQLTTDVFVTPGVDAPDERLAGFIHLWSEVKYNSVFLPARTELDWDEVLTEYLPRVQAAKDEYEYCRILKQCIALLCDGHTDVNGPTSPEPVARPNLLIMPIESKAIVAACGNSPELKAAGITPGVEIVSVAGRTVKDVLEKDLYPYISASTPQARDLRAYAQLLDGPGKTKVKVAVRSLKGATREVTLERSSGDFLRPPFPSSNDFYRELPNGLSYVRLQSFSGGDVVRRFDEAFGKISSSKGLIIDVRGNGGGSTQYASAIAGYLTDKPLAASHWKTRDYRPAFRAWGEDEKWFEGDHDQVEPVKGKKPFLGNVVILVNAWVVSAAEDFLVPLHASGRVKLVGEPTCGSTGQPLMVQVTSRITARICSKWDSYPDGREFVGVGIQPDIVVHPTAADIAAGRDAILEKGIEVLSSKTATPRK